MKKRSMLKSKIDYVLNLANYKYFIVPYNTIFDDDMALLKEALTIIGQYSGTNGKQSNYKKGLKIIANATGASCGEVKQIVTSFPSYRASKILQCAVEFKKISKEKYLSIINTIGEKLVTIPKAADLINRISNLDSQNTLRRNCTRAEYDGLTQIHVFNDEFNKINRCENSFQICQRIIEGIQLL